MHFLASHGVYRAYFGITDADMKYFQRNNCGLCPVAKCIRRTCPQARCITVGCDYVEFVVGDEPFSCHSLPVHVRDFIFAIDSGETPEPIEFHLDLHKERL